MGKERGEEKEGTAVGSLLLLLLLRNLLPISEAGLGGRDLSKIIIPDT